MHPTVRDTIAIMPAFVRWFVPGGTYFFTVVTERRAPLFADARWRTLLGDVMRQVCTETPFVTVASVLLPDHLHTVWALPPEDDDFPRRWKEIKSRFTECFLDAGGTEQPRSASRLSRGARGVWQRRFWEHLVRDEDDLGRHIEYIHFNPVKHRLVRCPHEWPHSSFHRWVARGDLAADWCCVCDGRNPAAPTFDWTPDGLE
jgi:putative transposase